MPRRPGSIDVDQIDFSEAVSQNVVFSGSVKFANLGPKGNPLVIDVDGQVSGSDFLTIDSTNNQIGVNTDTPKYILDIKTNNGGIRLGNTTNSGEKSSNIHFTELADANGLNAYGFSLKYNASDNAFNVMRHNNNTSGVSVMNFSRAFGNVQIGDVDPTRFGGTGVPKLWVNADVNDRGIIRCSQHSADSDPPQFEISKARGTMESPAAVQSLDYIAQLRAMGHDGTNFQISSDLLWIASDDFTSTSRPSTLTIRTVASGTTSPAERMRITHDGNIGIGTTTPTAKLDINGNLTVSGSTRLSGTLDLDYLEIARSSSIDAKIFSNRQMRVGANDNLSFTIQNDGNVKFENAVTSSHFKVEGSGGQFVAHNEDTVKLKHVNWYSSNDRQYGQGQLWYQQWFGAVEPSDSGDQGGRRIGFFFHKPNKGASDADGGTSAHPTNTHMFLDRTGMFLETGSLNVGAGNLQITGSDGSSGAASFEDYVIAELSIPGLDLQTDTNAFRFNCPYGLTVEGLTLYLDQHTTSGNVTVTVTNTTDTNQMISLSITGTNTSATTTTVSNAACGAGDVVTFAITATPANAQGLRANLRFRRNV